MKKIVLSAFLVLATMVGVKAQKAGYDPVNAPYGHGEDSVKCLINLSLMSTAAKAEVYQDALEPWEYVYKNCPASSKNIYIYGPRIFKFLHAKETDPAKKKALVDKVMEIYDTRLKYFGNDDPKGTILAYKTYDYMEMMGDEADSKVIYEWLKEAILDMKDKMDPPDAYGYFMVASLTEFLKDEAKKEQYLQDYFMVTGFLDQAIANAKARNDEESVNYLAAVKDGIVQGFISSGAGDCETLTQYYADKIEPNKTNKEFLNEVVIALKTVGCTESDIYFTAAEYLYKLEPSADAAIGLANRSLKNKDYDTAIKYYEEAAKLEPDKDKASEYLYTLAAVLCAQGNYSRARQIAYKSLEYNPNNGKNYILIAQMYAASAGNIFQEPEKRGLVYCAAVDKLQKAKAVDPSVAAEANELINKYSAYFMDTETAFMMGIKEGDTVYIPGWIGENTVVRLK